MTNSIVLENLLTMRQSMRLFYIFTLLLTISCNLDNKPKKTDQNNSTINNHNFDDINQLSDIDAIIKHQEKRFNELETILKKDQKYLLKFPGKSAQQHYLGTGIAKQSWSPADHNKMVKYIASKISDLLNKYPQRIFLGMIGDYAFDSTTKNCNRNIINAQGVPGLQNDNTFIIHIWGANASNFNLPLNQAGSFGSGQASCFKEQRLGVFGISTMPPGSKKALLFETDKLLNKY